MVKILNIRLFQNEVQNGNLNQSLKLEELHLFQWNIHIWFYHLRITNSTVFPSFYYMWAFSWLVSAKLNSGCNPYAFIWKLRQFPKHHSDLCLSVPSRGISRVVSRTDYLRKTGGCQIREGPNRDIKFSISRNIW